MELGSNRRALNRKYDWPNQQKPGVIQAQFVSYLAAYRNRRGSRAFIRNI